MERNTRIAFYGGSFDPIHRGHLAIAKALIGQFGLDEFVFIPAFHAPHKKRIAPTPALVRYTMLCLATNNESTMSVSKMEIEVPVRPYTVETLTRLTELLPSDELFFVMGSDSWSDIRTWREWEKVLTLTNHIVVTRPGYDISQDHVSKEIRDLIVDLRGNESAQLAPPSGRHIYFTDAVNLDISASEIRKKIRENDDNWREDVTPEVAKYIEKYQIYN